MHKFFLALFFGIFAVALFEVARAEPPAHAPAHGDGPHFPAQRAKGAGPR